MVRMILIETALLALLSSAAIANADDSAETDEPVQGDAPTEVETVGRVLDRDMSLSYAQYLQAGWDEKYSFTEYTFRRYRAMRNAGVVFTTVLFPLFALGTGLGLIWYAAGGEWPIFMVGCIVTGLTLLLGVVMWIVGQKRKNKLERLMPGVRATGPMLDIAGVPDASGLTFGF